MDSNNIKITPEWRKSKEQIWAEKFEHLSDKPKVVRIYHQRWFSYAVAAVLLVAVIFPVAAYIYKVRLTTKQKPTIKVTDNKKEAVTTTTMFDFNDAPLEDVISVIEREYTITIIRPTDMNHRYTGTFSRKRSAEDVLKIVGEPFGITLKVKD